MCNIGDWHRLREFHFWVHIPYPSFFTVITILSTGSTSASSSAQQTVDSFKSRTMVVGQAMPTEDTPMEVDSENPIPNLNSQSDSSSREGMEGVVQQDSAIAEMVVQAQEALLRSESLSLSLYPFSPCAIY